MLKILAILTLLTAPAAAAADFDPSDGDVIAFDVYRDGSPFGSHVLTFDREGDSLRVVSDIELIVRVGPVTVFRYEHWAEEVWSQGELRALNSTSRKDGRSLTVALERSGGDMTGTGSDYRGRAIAVATPAHLLPSSHWRGYPEDASLILNTETGEPMDVSVDHLGVETITVAGRRIEARRVRLAGTLTVDLWYGPDGEWVRCVFQARGQTVEYVRRA